MTPVAPAEQRISAPREQQLRSLANKIEAQFLAEMLKSAGVGKARDSFGGGAGEDQFASFLTAEYATSAVNAGGIGLSEAIFRSLTEKDTGR